MRGSDSAVFSLELPSNSHRHYQRAPIRQEQEGRPPDLGLPDWFEMSVKGMERTRFAARCPDCKAVIREAGGARECACKGWPFDSVERGTRIEEEYLEANGFRFAKDPSG